MGRRRPSSSKPPLADASLRGAAHPHRKAVCGVRSAPAWRKEVARQQSWRSAAKGFGSHSGPLAFDPLTGAIPAQPKWSQPFLAPWNSADCALVRAGQ